MRPKAPRVGDKCGRQVGDKCKLMRPKAPRVGDTDKWETSVNSWAQGTESGRQVWETSVEDKWKTSVNSCGPRHPECETSVKDKCGRRVWETSVKCKLMRPKI